MSMTHTALIIDDEADIRELIALSLDRVGLDTHTAANLEEARHLLANYTFDVCLTDMRLPDGNGVEFVKHIQQVQPDLPVAVITAHGNMDAAVEAMKNGAFDFVSKPVDISLLRKLVMQAIQTNEKTDYSGSKLAANSDSNSSQHDKQNGQANDDGQHKHSDTHTHTLPHGSASTVQKELSSLVMLSGRKKPATPERSLTGDSKLIGTSEPMQALRRMIAKVARTNAPVWITGESGTGKELIARLIHENSPRSEAPFVAINCGAIPSELMESEMFGHLKGSFTGAHTDNIGLFKRAEGGTLFLDEVAELPLSMQVKLLRAIQERAIRPVGSSNEISTDVRILSASHKDLANEVDAGNFRHDLYYRLNVISIKSPSLRERASDVADIARFILLKIAFSEGNTKPAYLSPEAEDALQRYTFPGNVRELENILERAVAMSDDYSIAESDLNITTPREPSESIQLGNSSRATDTPISEQQLIEQTLVQTQWNRKAAARLLGMSYRQIRYRIQQYGIGEKNTGT